MIAPREVRIAGHEFLHSLPAEVRRSRLFGRERTFGREPTRRGDLEIVFDPPGHSRLPINDDELVDQAQAIQALAGREVTMFTYDTGQAGPRARCSERASYVARVHVSGFPDAALAPSVELWASATFQGVAAKPRIWTRLWLVAPRVRMATGGHSTNQGSVKRPRRSRPWPSSFPEVDDRPGSVRRLSRTRRYRVRCPAKERSPGS